MACLEEECVGASSRDVLENVRRTAKTLLHQALLGAVQEVANEREAEGMDALIRLGVVLATLLEVLLL